MDITSIIGLLAGLAAMIGGFLWEGGSLSGLLQLNAALIVFGGTLAAVLISFPASRLRSVPAALRLAFGRHPDTTQEKAEELISMAAITPRRRARTGEESGGAPRYLYPRRAVSNCRRHRS